MTKHHAKMDLALFSSGFRGATPSKKYFETSMFGNSGRGSMSVRSTRLVESARKRNSVSNMKLNNKKLIANS